MRIPVDRQPRTVEEIYEMAETVTEGNRDVRHRRAFVDRLLTLRMVSSGSQNPEEVVKAEELPNNRDSLTQDHVDNFLQCVKTRERPNGDVLIGHRSAQASHLGNLAYEQRRRLDFDTVREEILPL